MRARGASARPVAVPRRRRPSGSPVRRPPVQVSARFPNPRLTGLGCGILSGLLMLFLGFVDAQLFGASLTVYGVLFVPVCLLIAFWVRRGDLLSAPVVLPIAFAVGLFTVCAGDDGLGNRLMALVTALATQALWLYAGTLTALVTSAVRRLRLPTAQRGPVLGRR